MYMVTLWFNNNAAAAAKNDINKIIKNVKNVTRCRDSRTPKSWETRNGYDHTKQLSIRTPYISFFIIHVLWKISVGGLYT